MPISCAPHRPWWTWNSQLDIRLLLAPVPGREWPLEHYNVPEGKLMPNANTRGPSGYQALMPRKASSALKSIEPWTRSLYYLDPWPVIDALSTTRQEPAPLRDSASPPVKWTVVSKYF